MWIPYVPIVLVLVGLCVYFGAARDKVAESGRILYFWSLGVLLLANFARFVLWKP